MDAKDAGPAWFSELRLFRGDGPKVVWRLARLVFQGGCWNTVGYGIGFWEWGACMVKSVGPKGFRLQRSRPRVSD